MKLKILSWNVRKATKNSNSVWDIISQLDPDLLTLQEVVSFPTSITDKYCIYYKKAISKKNKTQIFGTAILVRIFLLVEGEILKDFPQSSQLEWVNKELEFFNGNLLFCEVKIKALFPIRIVSVYSPAWPVDGARLKDIDVSSVKLKQNPQVWCTEILWSVLKHNQNLESENWIVTGDFNSSVTFDEWKGGPRGNQEIINRMNALGLTECLFSYNGTLIPTFKNPRGGVIKHQIDHMYVTKRMRSALTKSIVKQDLNIFEENISDHLPIISDFDFAEVKLPKVIVNEQLGSS